MEKSSLWRWRGSEDEIGDQFWPTRKSKKRGRPKKCEDPFSPTVDHELPAVDAKRETLPAQVPGKGKYTGNCK